MGVVDQDKGMEEEDDSLNEIIEAAICNFEFVLFGSLVIDSYFQRKRSPRHEVMKELREIKRIVKGWIV